MYNVYVNRNLAGFGFFRIVYLILINVINISFKSKNNIKLLRFVILYIVLVNVIKYFINFLVASKVN